MPRPISKRALFGSPLTNTRPPAPWRPDVRPRLTDLAGASLAFEPRRRGGDRTGPPTRKVADGAISVGTRHRRRPGNRAFIRDRGLGDVQLERAAHREPHDDSRRSVVGTDDGCRSVPAVAVSRRSLVAAAHR